MYWLIDLLLTGGGVAHTVILYSFVIAFGVFLGSKLKIKGVSLGVTWILFVGILVGDLLKRADVTENMDVLNFVQDFGLILFVFSIGLQVGPSFFTSLFVVNCWPFVVSCSLLTVSSSLLAVRC